MNDSYMAIAADVWERLQSVEAVVLTETDLRKHSPVSLTRASANLIAGFLVDQARVCAGVEIFINQTTGKTESIQILVTRSVAVYQRERDRLEADFRARASSHDEIVIDQEINVIRHPE